ncbi:hypothetical protein [Thalassospira sp.]|uniref:hypothetical protein n=1 Tax=Thalassospira sp. TaxID=1912094 RepID=UPI003AA9D007
MLRVATISMKRCNGINQAEHNARKEFLCLIVESPDAPDLIVCASDYFSTEAKLIEFCERRKELDNRSTYIVTTVGNSKKGKKDKKGESEKYPGLDYIYVIFPDGSFEKLAQQFISTRDNYKFGEEDFIKNLENRRFELPNGDQKFSCSVLSCGEINAFHGRENVVALHSATGNLFDDVDIILNPTHDRMSNDGAVDAKRRHLSQVIDGRHRCYISVSNWEVCSKSQKKDASTLHTIYSSNFDEAYGYRNETVERQFIDGFEDLFEYRRSTVSFE